MEVELGAILVDVGASLVELALEESASLVYDGASLVELWVDVGATLLEFGSKAGVTVVEVGLEEASACLRPMRTSSVKIRRTRVPNIGTLMSQVFRNICKKYMKL